MIDTLYRRGETFLHRYDCRLKLLLLPLFTVVFLLPLSWFSLAGAAGLLLVTASAAVGRRDMWIPFRMIWPLLLFILLLTPLFHRSGPALITAGEMVLVTLEGLTESLKYIFRFLGITYLFFLFFRTTPMEDLLLGLAWFRLPYTATLVISIALRYIPHLAGLYGRIKGAHALRCGTSDLPLRKERFARIKKIFPILVSLMIQSVKTIPVLTMALELKGIGRTNRRTRLRGLPDNPALGRQILLSAVLLVLVAATLILLR